MITNSVTNAQLGEVNKTNRVSIAQDTDPNTIKDPQLAGIFKALWGVMGTSSGSVATPFLFGLAGDRDSNNSRLLSAEVLKELCVDGSRDTDPKAGQQSILYLALQREVNAGGSSYATTLKNALTDTSYLGNKSFLQICQTGWQGGNPDYDDFASMLSDPTYNQPGTDDPLAIIQSTIQGFAHAEANAYQAPVNPLPFSLGNIYTYLSNPSTTNVLHAAREFQKIEKFIQDYPSDPFAITLNMIFSNGVGSSGYGAMFSATPRDVNPNWPGWELGIQGDTQRYDPHSYLSIFACANYLVASSPTDNKLAANFAARFTNELDGGGTSKPGQQGSWLQMIGAMGPYLQAEMFNPPS